MSGIRIRRVLPRQGHTSQYVAYPFLGQCRTFSVSHAHQKQGFPKFQPTSSPDLDNILSKFRDTVFLPAQLSKEHRKVIYRTKSKQDLENTPLVVDIGGEEVRLKHINQLRDVPNQNKGVQDALKLMKEKKDWDNFPLLLEGLQFAGRRLPGYVLDQFVMRAGRAGRQDAIIESARRAAKTGFRISTRETAKRVMWYIQYRAMVNDFKPAETKKALSMAEQIAILMEDEAHAGGRVINSEDPRTSPEVIGFLLELSALNAKYEGGKDDGSVEKYAKNLLASLRNNELEGIGMGPDADQIAENNCLLQSVAPILLGVRTAISILGPASETTKQLRDLETRLAAQAASGLETVNAKPTSSKLLGVWAYEQTVKVQ